MSRPRFVLVPLIILAAAASRLIPHPPNLASITAVALLGGAYLTDKRIALIVPLAALLLSDLVLGFYSHMEVLYGKLSPGGTPPSLATLSTRRCCSVASHWPRNYFRFCASVT
jgi:hypothetical protein